MQEVVRIALPGYNALTDTNIDHFSVYADVDNVLIKRKLTGTGTVAIASGLGYTIDTITHGLGYIPFFSVYANYNYFTGTNYKMLNNEYNPFAVPPAVCAADTQKLYIVNFDGSNTLPYSYDIFYDDMSQTGSPTITESPNVLKVARPNKNTSSLNPNDYIMHSDLNNFKILKQAKTTVSLTSGNNSFAHGVSLNTPYKYFCFVKFPDGKTTMVGSAQAISYDDSKSLYSGIDGTNIYLYASGNFTVDVTYFIIGSATDNSITNNGYVIAIPKAGKNALTETNPDNFNFHSNYSTLKYYSSGNWNMGSITVGNIKTIAHSLGYVPFFLGFVNDPNNFNIFNGNSENVYAMAPYYLGRSTIPHPTQDIGAFMYADATNIYLKAYYQTNAVGTAFSFNWYYKLFKNNLGL